MSQTVQNKEKLPDESIDIYFDSFATINDGRVVRVLTKEDFRKAIDAMLERIRREERQ